MNATEQAALARKLADAMVAAELRPMRSVWERGNLKSYEPLDPTAVACRVLGEMLKWGWSFERRSADRAQLTLMDRSTVSDEEET